jgi:hypothetical protein
MGCAASIQEYDENERTKYDIRQTLNPKNSDGSDKSAKKIRRETLNIMYPYATPLPLPKH